MMDARALALRLPALEDANAIQISLMRVQKALIDDTITAKKAGLLLYSLQLTMTNVGQTTFGEADEQELVTELVDEEEAISSQHSAFSPTTFTTEGTEKSGEEPAEHVEKKMPGRGLPRINAEERGLGPTCVWTRDGATRVWTRDGATRVWTTIAPHIVWTRDRGVVLCAGLAEIHLSQKQKAQPTAAPSLDTADRIIAPRPPRAPYCWRASGPACGLRP